MNREDALPFVAAILDDAGGVIEKSDVVASKLRDTEDCVLVGFWQGDDPSVWAVRSYLGCDLGIDEAEDLVSNYLIEIGWFNAGPRVADFVLPPAE